MLHAGPMPNQYLIHTETLKVLMKCCNNFCEFYSYLPSLKQVEEKYVAVKKLINLR